MNQDDVSTAGAGHDVCGVVHEAILETRFISQQQRDEWHVASDVVDPLDRSRRGWAWLVPHIIVTAAHAAVLSALSFADHPRRSSPCRGCSVAGYDLSNRADAS